MSTVTDLIGSIVEAPKTLDDKGTPSQERVYAVVRGFYLDGRWPRFILQTIAHLEEKGVERGIVREYGGHLIERAVRDCRLCSNATVDEFLRIPPPSPAPPAAAAAKRGGK